MSNQRIAHVPNVQFPVVDDCLQVGGVALTRLARRVGTTPFNAYDRAPISARVVELRKHLPHDVHLHYAVKANPMPPVVQHLSGLVDGLDVASSGEMRVALDTGVAPKLISFAGPGKTGTEIAQAAAAGIVVNLESEGEMNRIATLASNFGVRPRGAVRVNPDFELKSAGMKMGGSPKQFGVDAECVPAMLARIRQIELDFQDFHIFSGAQNLRAGAIQEAQQKTIELAIRLAEHAPAPVRVLNIGGGFGIPYLPGDQSLDIAAVGANLMKLLPKVRHWLPQAQVVVELGRHFVGEAGIYVCRVIDRTISRGHVFLVTDGGLHYHLSESGNFGQVIRKNYPVVVVNKVAGREREIASVVGPLCTPLDLIADSMELAKQKSVIWVVVFQSGAYGLTANPTAFLSHPPPIEVLV